MKQNNLVIIKGKISQLESAFGQVDFGTARSDWIAKSGVVAQMMLGNNGTGSASAGLIATDRVTQRVRHFRCYIGQIPVMGYFDRLQFNNGDEVEVVAELQPDGCYYVYALRRSIDHRLWLQPHTEKGSEVINSEKWRAFRWGGGLGFFSSIICAIGAFFIMQKATLPFEIIIFSTLIMTIFCAYVARFGYGMVLGGNAPLADKIFTVLGYEHPESVNMMQEYLTYIDEVTVKGKGVNPYIADIDTPQYKQKIGGLWVYKYRTAPPLPDWVTVIESKAEE